MLNPFLTFSKFKMAVLSKGGHISTPSGTIDEFFVNFEVLAESIKINCRIFMNTIIQMMQNMYILIPITLHSGVTLEITKASTISKFKMAI